MKKRDWRGATSRKANRRALKQSQQKDRNRSRRRGLSLGSWLKQRCRGNVGPGGKELQMIADWRREDVCSGRDLISRIGRKGRGCTKYGEDWREGEERKGGGKERGAGGDEEEEAGGGRGGGDRKKRQPQVSSGFPFAPSSLGQRSSGKFILLGFFVFLLLLGDLFLLFLLFSL